MSDTAEIAESERRGTGEPAPVPASRRPSLWRGVLPAVLGVAGFVWATLSLRGEGWVQLAAVLVSVALMYSGASALARRRFGDSFDLIAWLCVVWLVVLTLAAVFAPLLPLPEHQDVSTTFGEATMARPDLTTDHPLGTNNFGLDLLARAIYGSRASLVVSIAAVVIGLVVGGALGIAAGYFRKGVDVVSGILTNSLLAVPPLVLLIALAAVLEPNLRNLAFALSLLALPSMIRMARASTLTFVQREFVLAGKAMGASNLRIMVRELLPNVLLPLLSYAMVVVSVLIVAEASLSFLGLGIQPPEPSWGNMIAEGEGTTFERHPHIVLVPGFFVFMTVFAFNMLGEKARKRFDPRQAKI